MTTEAKELARNYWDFINELIELHDNIGKDEKSRMLFFRLDHKRVKMHDELCELLKVKKEKMKSITDNLDQYDCFGNFLKALEKLINDENENL